MSTAVKKNIIVLLPLILLVSYVNADDLIVDKKALSQYKTDDHLLFDPFNSNSDKKCCDEVDLSDNAPILGAQFTQEAWIWADDKGAQHRKIMGSAGTSTSPPKDRSPTISYHYNINQDYNEIRYGFGYGGSSSINVTVGGLKTDNTWTHIATTFDGTNYKLFVNGEEVNNYTDAAGLTPLPTPVRFIGATHTSLETQPHEFIGKIDEVRMWSVARTQAEIQETMNDTLSGDETGLVAYYPMDVNNNWELVDHSPNENHVRITDVEVASEYFSDDCPAPDGSLDCPFPTIRSALDDVQPGDRIYIREGRYTELLNKFKFQTSDGGGIEGVKIVIEGYPNEKVIIDGTVSISAQWEPYNHNGYDIYKAVLDLDSISDQIKTPVDSIYSVFVDGRYMIPAMPTNFKNPTDPTTGNPKNPEPGTVWEKRLKSPTLYPETVDPLGYMPGKIAYLDTLEEWSFNPDNNTLYLYASDNYIPTSTNVRVRVRDKFLSFQAADNIEFRNLHFFAGSFSFQGCSYLTIEDCKFSFSSDVGLTGNKIVYGRNTTVRNSIFEYTNDGHTWSQQRTIYPTMENVLFRNNDWFSGTAWSPTTDRNYRGTKHQSEFFRGDSHWRYITIENSFTAGVFAGYGSLVEYSRFENLYDGCDCSALQRNGAGATFSTTRYTWLINAPGLNGMRFDSGCGGTNGDIYNVVSIGNSRGFRLKGDYHDVYHVTAYDNTKQDVSLPSYKYCGPDRGGGPEIGNWNSNLHNALVQGSLECYSHDCWAAGKDPITLQTGDFNPSKDFFHLDSVGIWFGRPLSVNAKTGIPNNSPPWAAPHLELEAPWIKNRARSDLDLIEKFGAIPWDDPNQDYDFRPKKGSYLIDSGVIIPGINDGKDENAFLETEKPGVPVNPRSDTENLTILNHPPLYPGQNRKFVGDAPDIGAYEYGDSVYWIPGFRYPHPSVPIPKNNAANVPMDYSLAWNYPYKKDYSATTATVSISGPGVNRTESFDYPYNVLFQTFQPGGTYNWSVSVDGVSGGSWTFQVDDKIYPTNDRSIDTTASEVILPYLINNLIASNNRLAFLRFDIPSSVNSSYQVILNLVPEKIVKLNGGIVVYKYDQMGWGEKNDDNNIGTVDHSLGIPIDTLYTIEAGVPIAVNISDIINSSGEFSFGLGVLDTSDNVSFYSKEKLLTDGVSGYAPQMSVWPSLSFSKDSLSVAYDIPLEKEWNLISVPFTGVKTRPKQIFSTLIRKGLLEYVSSPSGYFKPGDPYSTLTSISSKEGYYLKLNGPANKIFFRGRALTDKTISLSAGWNMIAYSPDYELAVDKAFESLIASNTLQYVTGFVQGALVYDPDAPQSSTLNTLKPTKGYWVKVNAAVTNFSFPAQTQGGASGKIVANHSVKHPEVKPNPSFMFVKGKIMGSRYNVGDWVKVLSEDNHVVGAAEIIEGGYLRNSAVYGDDVTTEDIDGLKSGEKVSFAYDGDTLTSHVQFNPMSFHDVKLDYDTFLPTTFALHQNHPNPFNPITTIRYDLPEDGPVSIIIYDLMGREIKTLVKQVSAPGRYSVNWNGRNQFGKQIASGMYFYRMETPKFQSVKKLIFLK